IGKIYAKAQELKMNVNNDLVYFVSDEKRQKALADYEGGLFEKLQKKAQRLIGDKEYSLGAVSNISVTSLASDNSRYSYRSYNQEYLTNSANSITQTQAAQDVDINPPSAHEITIKISAGFDIVSGVKR
ncbi:MAG: hypothetical protein LBQ18_04000, partial [Campylobacteraceae bacterium]|nr:hypothetical protein [Campylobacteraceae bacterium]